MKNPKHHKFGSIEHTKSKSGLVKIPSLTNSEMEIIQNIKRTPFHPEDEMMIFKNSEKTD